MVGETTLDVSIFQEALEFSRFENMQKLEAAGVFDSKILHPGDVRDPESFKVRRGKVEATMSIFLPRIKNTLRMH